MDTVLYNQNFSAGVGMMASLPPTPSASTSYIGASTPVMGVQRFTVTDSAYRGDPANWIRLRDHTGNVNGAMLVVNADAAATLIYKRHDASILPRTTIFIFILDSIPWQ
jgi:hypothetical protein